MEMMTVILAVVGLAAGAGVMWFVQKSAMQAQRKSILDEAKKDAEITFLLAADKRQIEENEETQNALKSHIQRLQDKIFVIQRENEEDKQREKETRSACCAAGCQ